MKRKSKATVAYVESNGAVSESENRWAAIMAAGAALGRRRNIEARRKAGAIAAEKMKKVAKYRNSISLAAKPARQATTKITSVSVVAASSAKELVKIERAASGGDMAGIAAATPAATIAHGSGAGVKNKKMVTRRQTRAKWRNEKHRKAKMA
jgi:hypothetical protein